MYSSICFQLKYQDYTSLYLINKIFVGESEIAIEATDTNTDITTGEMGRQAGDAWNAPTTATTGIHAQALIFLSTVNLST